MKTRRGGQIICGMEPEPRPRSLFGQSVPSSKERPGPVPRYGPGSDLQPYQGFFWDSGLGFQFRVRNGTSSQSRASRAAQGPYGVGGGGAKGGRREARGGGTRDPALAVRQGHLLPLSPGLLAVRHGREIQTLASAEPPAEIGTARCSVDESVFDISTTTIQCALLDGVSFHAKGVEILPRCDSGWSISPVEAESSC